MPPPPPPPPPPHDYPYHWVILDPKSKEDKVKVTNLKNLPKFQIFEFWNGHYTQHTFWSCLIRCANMKWIQWVLLKIQSGHDTQTDRQTDGQGDTSIHPFQLRWSGGYKYVPYGANDNKTTLVQIMAWHQTTDKPLSEAMLVCFTDAYMRHSASMS